MKKNKLIRKWGIPGVGRIKLAQKPTGKYFVRFQPFEDSKCDGIRSDRWYAFTYQKEFETESDATWYILDRLDAGDI